MKHLLSSLTLLMVPAVFFAQGIKIHGSTQVIAGSDVNIVLNGISHWENCGNFEPAQSSLIFSGNTNQQILGCNPTEFHNLILDKSASDVQLHADINVKNQLTLTSGQLDLQNSNIDLGTTGTIMNETEVNRIKVSDVVNHTGTIQATRTVNNVTDYNPANLGVLISTNVNMGTITIVRGHQVQNGSGSFAGNGSIARYVEVPNIGQLDASDKVKMQYWDAELNGHTESELIQYQWVTESAQSWWTPLTGTVNTSDNTYTPADNAYSEYFDEPNWYSFNYTEKFTLGSESSPLPVEWLSFDGWCHEDFVNIEWETASEDDNEVFIIQRSTDGRNFSDIGSVPGAGNSNQILAYSFFDTNPQKEAYYRIKQIDYDGAFQHSDVIYLTCSGIPEPFFRVYPNPFKDQLNVMAGNLPASESVLEIFSMDGKRIRQYHLNEEGVGWHKIINTAGLVPAMYMIRIISDDYVKTLKIEKQ
ncbi:MAG: T9SS type A sorting domain-containing protein [Bacteroidota bacterium]